MYDPLKSSAPPIHIGSAPIYTNLLLFWMVYFTTALTALPEARRTM